MKKYEAVEYEESDYEEFDDSVKKMSNKEIADLASRVISGYFVPRCRYGSPAEDDFEDYKKDKIIKEALKRLRSMWQFSC